MPLQRLLGLAGGRQQTVELLELVIRQVFERIWDFLGVLRQERCYEPHVRGRVLPARAPNRGGAMVLEVGREVGQIPL
jgi:hypothetical protein